jgi:hypothetical protein
VATIALLACIELDHTALCWTLEAEPGDNKTSSAHVNPVLTGRPLFRGIALFLVWAATLVGAAAAQERPAPAGAIAGTVTSQRGTIPLGGAQVALRDTNDRELATLLSDGNGGFRFVALRDARYRIVASLAGFETTTVDTTVTAGRETKLALDLPIAAVSQTVDVVGTSPIISTSGTLSSTETVGGAEIDQFSPGGGLQGALRLLASIIEVPGGVSINGGRPSQAAVQLGTTTLVDPATGLAQVSLPDDAIDSVAVLPNPSAVEYGRFSSGLIVIHTRRGGDRWKTRVNNLDPTFRTRRDNMFDVIGVSAFGPRFETGGPLVKDRLFLEQTAQFRYGASDVPSRPEDELRTTKWFSSFTRADAVLSPKRSMVITGGIFPSVSSQATLGTFTPPDATADIQSHVNHGGLTERALWSDSLFSETTAQVHEYQTDVMPQGSLPMILRPDTTLGNFFNRQQRQTVTYQVVEAVTGSRPAFGGLHLFKAGVDLLHSAFDGWSESRPVLIQRADGTLARRLDFLGPTTQSIATTDVALFAQDRFQPGARWYTEFGGRVDRDGVVRQWNVTPRVGAAVLLNDTGTAVLRGGYGLFFERTPSTAGTFDSFDNAIDRRFAADGVTPLGPPMLQTLVADSHLETPRSAAWDLAYDYRVNPQWSLHLGAVHRSGTHELVVDPARAGNLTEIHLSSTGVSLYREAEVGVQYTRGTALDLHASYVRSAASGDLNPLTNYFDTVLWPVVGANARAALGGDAPNRLLARGRVMPTSRWLLLGILDWRSGLPYSTIDDMLEYVGPRNVRRFPTYARTELGIEHRFKILGVQPWIGIRAYNALNAFLPTDVQANIGSPNFGSFYNSEYRQFRLQVRFER